MKTKNKVLLIVACVCLIVATTVMATMAYLVDSAEVVNTFTVGNVQLKLDETAVNPDGTPTSAGRVEAGNEYHLIPGKTYTKDPMVTVKAGSEDCYVRMLVTLNCKSALDEIFAPGVNMTTIFNGYNAAWVYETEVVDTVADTVTYEFRYPEFAAVSTDTALPELFTSFTVPGTLDGEDLAKLQNFKITVVAHAIQAAGFADEDAAWTAFDAQTVQP